MATDRDEQLHEQQRQQQELEEIRRSFAEMGARMGSLFEPAELDEPAGAAVRAAGPAGRPSGAAAARGATPLVVAAALPRCCSSSAACSAGSSGATGARSPRRPRPPWPRRRCRRPRRRRSSGPRPACPRHCLDTAELGDEVIARLNRNQRDNRLFLALRDYTIASQACREASP